MMVWFLIAYCALGTDCGMDAPVVGKRFYERQSDCRKVAALTMMRMLPLPRHTRIGCASVSVAEKAPTE